MISGCEYLKIFYLTYFKSGDYFLKNFKFLGKFNPQQCILPITDFYFSLN